MSLQIDTLQEAYLAIMYACISVDDKVTEDETDEMIQMLMKNEIFENADLMAIYKKVQLINQSMRFDPYKIIEMAAPKISHELRSAILATAVNMLQADGVVFNVEKDLLEHLRKHLYLDRK
jgi:tellurite resistance protein